MPYSGTNAAAEIVTGAASRALPVSLKSRTLLAAAQNLGLLYKMLGLYGAEVAPVQMDADQYLRFESENLKYTEGYEYEMYIAGIYPKINTIRNGSDETKFINPQFNPNLFATFKGVQTHFNDDIVIPKSEVDKATNRAKGETVVERYSQAFSYGAAQTIHQMLWENVMQTETAILGIPFAVKETGNYFLDRSQPENAYWKAVAENQGGAFNNLDKVALLQSRIKGNNGKGDVIAAGTNVFSWFRRRLEITGNLAQYYGKIEFGGDMLVYGNSVITQDILVPQDGSGNEQLFILSSDKWCAYSQNSPDASPFAVAQYLNNAVHGKVDFYLGLACHKCNEQGYLYGITAPA